MDNFEGKVAVVTGAASGIGKALAERFAREGMKVVRADIEDVALQAAVAELRQHLKIDKEPQRGWPGGLFVDL